MKKIIALSLVFILVFPAISLAQKQKKYKIHPSFLRLLKQYPRDKDILYPMVPRVSADEAYAMFISNKAVLIDVGAREWRILGAKKLNMDYKNPKLIRKLKTIKNKFILLFCG